MTLDLVLKKQKHSTSWSKENIWQKEESTVDVKARSRKHKMLVEIRVFKVN